MSPAARERTEAMLRKVEAGERDVYC